MRNQNLSHQSARAALLTQKRAGKAPCEAPYVRYEPARQRRRRAFGTQPPGDRAVLARGVVKPGSCSEGCSAAHRLAPWDKKPPRPRGMV